MFYSVPMRTEYREEPCRTALNRVTGMGFRWSLNPYMGCAHRYRRLYPAGGSGYLGRRKAAALEARAGAVRRGAGIADRRRIRLAPEPDPEQLYLPLG